MLEVEPGELRVVGAETLVVEVPGVTAAPELAGDLTPRYSALAKADEEWACKNMWLLELSGDQADIEELKELAQVVNCHIAPDHDSRGWLSGGTFDNLSSVEEVREKAIEILRLLNGIARSRSYQFRPVQFWGVSQKRPDGTKAHFTAACFAGRGRFPGGEDVGGIQRAQRIIDDPKLCKIAEAIGGEITFQKLRVALEKFGEMITGRSSRGSWNAALVKNGYTTKAELDDFWANTDDPRLSGLDAVHGVPNSPAPKGANMTEEQGLEFVVRLLNTYLDRQL